MTGLYFTTLSIQFSTDLSVALIYTSSFRVFQGSVLIRFFFSQNRSEDRNWMKNINVTALTVIYEEVIMTHNCVKSVQIRSYFWSVFSCIRTSNNSVFGLFSPSDSLQNCKLIRVIFFKKQLFVYLQH